MPKIARLPKIAQNCPAPDAPTPAMLVAVRAIMSGKTFSEAAQLAGVSRRQLFTWRHVNPEFITELNSACSESRAAASYQLNGLAASAVQTLKGLMEAESTPASTRAQIALRVLAAAGVDQPPSGNRYYELDAVAYRAWRAEQENTWDSRPEHHKNAGQSTYVVPIWREIEELFGQSDE